MLLAQPQWGANQALRNTLRDHIVNKGHFGFLPFPSLETPRTEDKGMVRVQRLNVNEPRSYFVASATLEPLIDDYATEITAKLANLRQQDRLKPSGKITVHSTDPSIPHTRIDNDHHTAYETVKNRMLEESSALLADIIDNNLYVAVAMDFDEKTDTIRIKANPATPDTMNREGHQPNVDMTGYNALTKSIFLYVQTDSGKVILATTFPGDRWDSLNTRQDIRNHGNNPIPYIGAPVITIP